MKIIVEVNVSEPEELSQGAFKTSITHPSLSGELSFIHDAKGLDGFLESIKSKRLLDEVLGAVRLLGELRGNQKDASSKAGNEPAVSSGNNTRATTQT